MALVQTAGMWGSPQVSLLISFIVFIFPISGDCIWDNGFKSSLWSVGVKMPATVAIYCDCLSAEGSGNPQEHFSPSFQLCAGPARCVLDVSKEWSGPCTGRLARDLCAAWQFPDPAVVEPHNLTTFMLSAPLFGISF